MFTQIRIRLALTRSFSHAFLRRLWLLLLPCAPLASQTRRTDLTLDNSTLVTSNTDAGLMISAPSEAGASRLPESTCTPPDIPHVKKHEHELSAFVTACHNLPYTPLPVCHIVTNRLLRETQRAM